MDYGKYKNARNASWQCILDYNISQLPVIVTDIIHQSDNIRLFKNSDVNLLKPGESGKTIYHNGIFEIVYRDTEPSYRCRFTIAHELGVGGKLKYIDDKGKGTYTETDTPKICDGLKFSALHKLKCLLTSMYSYALKNDIVNKNYAEFIILPERNETAKTRFTDLQLETVRENINTVPYADYIYCMCYLNFRVSEFLELTSDSYHISDTGIPVFVGGKKTEAGTDRIVPIHPKIQNIVSKCLERNGETIFCGSDGQALTADRFRKQCFYPAIEQMGLPDNLTPHSCRRTFSTRMSAAGARQEDIIALMGHTNFDVDINHYINQETDTLYKAILKMA